MDKEQFEILCLKLDTLSNNILLNNNLSKDIKERLSDIECCLNNLDKTSSDSLGVLEDIRDSENDF